MITEDGIKEISDKLEIEEKALQSLKKDLLLKLKYVAIYDVKKQQDRVNYLKKASKCKHPEEKLEVNNYWYTMIKCTECGYDWMY